MSGSSWLTDGPVLGRTRALGLTLGRALGLALRRGLGDQTAECQAQQVRGRGGTHADGQLAQTAPEW